MHLFRSNKREAFCGRRCGFRTAPFFSPDSVVFFLKDPKTILPIHLYIHADRYLILSLID